MTSRRKFDGVAGSVGEARWFSSEAIGAVPTDVRYAVSLLVSELATNALMHAASGFEIRIDRPASYLRVEVEDMGDGTPRVRSPGSTELHGRGLRIVQELSDDWGTISAPGQQGKTVWFTLHFSPGDGDGNGIPPAVENQGDNGGADHQTPTGRLRGTTDSSLNPPPEPPVRGKPSLREAPRIDSGRSCEPSAPRSQRPARSDGSVGSLRPWHTKS
jgi:anti-sigma regulatory factor (Ser/Thr protein kinase)